MKQIDLYSRSEFSKIIGISIDHLRKKEKNGELIPALDGMYTLFQAEKYIEKEKDIKTVFANNVEYLMNKHKISSAKLAKDTKVDLSTIIRMLDGISKHHRTSTVKKISEYFGYKEKNEIADFHYRYLKDHKYKIVPILNNIDINIYHANEIVKYIKYEILKEDFGKTSEIPDYAISIPKNYTETFDGSTFLLIILDNPIIGDTVIYSNEKKSLNALEIGLINQMTRTEFILINILNNEEISIKKDNVIGILKTNI